MRENELLERFNLVLQGHQIANGFVAVNKNRSTSSVGVHKLHGNLSVPFIGIIDVLQTNIFLILE